MQTQKNALLAGVGTPVASNATDPGNAIALTTTKAEARIDTRVLAKQLGNKHRHVMALLDKYLSRAKAFGHVSFKNADGERKQGGGKAERYALLNENQAYFVLSLSRNSEVVVALKAKLIQVFSDYRRAAEIRQTDYLPAHHLLQDAIKAADNGTPKGPHYYINAHNALNKLAGLQSGQRASAGPGALSLLTVGACLAAEAALQKGDGVLSLHQRIKAALMSLQGVPALLAHADMLHLPSNTGGNT